jgi:hypothetical protein
LAASRRFGCERTLCALQCNDHGYLIANQVSDQRRQQIVFTTCPPVFDRDVPVLDVANFAKASTEKAEVLTR